MKKELIIIGLIELVLGIEWMIVASLRYVNTGAGTDLSNNLLMAGAAFAGLSLILAALLALKTDKPSKNISWLIVLGLSAGLVLNLFFYFHPDGTAPASHSANLIMGGSQVILIAYYLMGLQRSSRTLKKLLG